jgi:hypothetical protein
MGSQKIMLKMEQRRPYGSIKTGKKRTFLRILKIFSGLESPTKNHTQKVCNQLNMINL